MVKVWYNLLDRQTDRQTGLSFWFYLDAKKYREAFFGCEVSN